MERYNTIVKIEEIKRLTEEGEIERAVREADAIEYERLRTVSDLSVLAEAYIRGKEFSKARMIYEKIFDRSRSRRVAMQLVNLSIKLKDIEAAEDYLQEFIRIAPDDFCRYIFRYSIDKLKGEPYEVLIDSLEKLKKKEYIEKWAYELAKLYHKAGMDQKCVDECSDIILWFGEGQYVERAKALRSYYYGEMDLGWLEESRLMETQPIPPLNLSLPKEPIPFAKPAPARPKKDGRFEKRMTGGYVSPIDGRRPEVPKAAVPEPEERGYRTEQTESREEEPLPVINTEGLFDAPEKGVPAEEKRLRPDEKEWGKESLAEELRRQEQQEEQREKQGKERTGQPEEKAAKQQEERNQQNNEAGEESGNGRTEETAESQGEFRRKEQTETVTEEQKGETREEPAEEPIEERREAGEERTDQAAEESGKRKSEEPEEGPRFSSVPSVTAGQEAQETVTPQVAMFRESLADQGLRYETLFGIYSRIPGMEESLARTLEDTVTGEAVQYNYQIVGEKSTGKTGLAKNLSRYLYKTGCIMTPRVALISGEKLNHINLIQKKEAIADCCMIIEEAGKMNTSSAAGLAHVIRAFNGRIAVILEDTQENMNRLAVERESLIRLFKSPIVLSGYTPEGLALITAELLKEKDYHLLEGAEEALTACLRCRREQTPDQFNLALADKIAAQAIARADKRNESELLKFAESGNLGKADLEGIAAEDFAEI